MRIDADAGEGKFGHVGLADNHRAGSAQAGDGGCLAGCRRHAAQQLGAGSGRFPGHVEEILDADDPAIQRAQAHPELGARIGRIGGGAGQIGIDLQHRAAALAIRVRNAAKAGFEAVAATGRHGHLSGD
jgi:hypothetical protein